MLEEETRGCPIGVIKKQVGKIFCYKILSCGDIKLINFTFTHNGGKRQPITMRLRRCNEGCVERNFKWISRKRERLREEGKGGRM